MRAILSVPRTPFITEYQNVYNAMVNKPNSAYAARQNTLVKALVDASLWSGKFDLFYVFANVTNDASEAQINWITPGTYNCANISNTAFMALEGFKGDGVADYLNTGWDPSANSVNYDLSTCSMGLYQRLNIDENTAAMGAYGNEDSQTYMQTRNSNTIYGMINSGEGNYVTITNSLGLLVLNRIDASYMSFYQNGTQLSNNSRADIRMIPSSTFHILTQKNWGGYSNNQVSMAFVGGLLSAVDISMLNSTFETYMDSNGKGVE
jgi:hypothetical protein